MQARNDAPTEFFRGFFGYYEYVLAEFFCVREHRHFPIGRGIEIVYPEGFTGGVLLRGGCFDVLRRGGKVKLLDFYAETARKKQAITVHQMGVLAQYVSETGKLLNGWIKSTKRK